MPMKPEETVEPVTPKPVPYIRFPMSNWPEAVAEGNEMLSPIFMLSFPVVRLSFAEVEAAPRMMLSAPVVML